MSSSINSVGGGGLFAAYRKPEVTTAGPALPTEASKPVPTSAQAPINGRLTLAEQVRAGLLEAHDKNGGPIGKMTPAARADFEDEIARQVQAQLRADPELQPGAFLDVKA